MADLVTADPVRRWVEESPYTAALGVRAGELTRERVVLELPFAEANANPGKALHGGCAASLAAVGGEAVTRLVLGEASGPWHTCALQVGYLAAAIDEDVVATARLLREGKQLCFIAIEVATRAGKPIAQASSVVRARLGAPEAELHVSGGDDGASDPGRMGPAIGKLPFVAGRGIVVEHMTGGTSRLRMPFRAANADASGGVHGGALLALLDTTGAMASWAETGPGPFKASTPALQAQILAPIPKLDLVAYGSMRQRDGELLWSDAEIASAADGRVFARGTVVYRIVT
ncbi:MAG TPA: PaaI family thioesterase [Myxococcota bacterium]